MDNAAHDTDRTMTQTPPPAAPPAGFWRKLLGNPIVRILLGSVLLIGLHPAVGLSLKFASSMLPPLAGWFKSSPVLAGTRTPLPAFYITTLLIILLSIPLYRLFVRWTERRAIDELAPHHAAAELGYGAMLGFALFSGVAGILWIGGYYRIIATNSADVMLPMALMSASAAIFEELLFRGVLFRIVEQSQGSWIALAVSSLFFGFAHLANPNGSLQAALAITIEAGILLGAAFMLTRRLWLVMGLHFAWNFSESGIYGMPVSGFSMPGLMKGAVNGPEWITGGAFGAENSLIAIVLCVGVAVCFLTKAKRRQRIMPRRSRQAT